MDEKDRSDGKRACSLIDLETIQKMRLNNLSNRSAHWDPKVFRKISKYIDPPKSPTETPPPDTPPSRDNMPDVKTIASKKKIHSLILNKTIQHLYNLRQHG